MNLSKRLRPDVECAPWVIEGVKELEAEIAALKAQLVGYAATIQRLGELTQQPIGFVQPEEMEKIKSLHHTRIYSVVLLVDTVSGHDGIAIYAAPQATGEKP